MRLSTRFVRGSMRRSRLSEGQVTHREFSAKATLLQPAGSRSSPATTFWIGSMRESVVLPSVMIHTLSAVAAIPSITSTTPVFSVAVTLFVFVS